MSESSLDLMRDTYGFPNLIIDVLKSAETTQSAYWDEMVKKAEANGEDLKVTIANGGGDPDKPNKPTREWFMRGQRTALTYLADVARQPVVEFENYRQDESLWSEIPELDRSGWMLAQCPFEPRWDHSASVVRLYSKQTGDELTPALALAALVDFANKNELANNVLQGAAGE